MGKKTQDKTPTITDEFDALCIMQRQNAVIPLQNDGTKVLLNPDCPCLLSADPESPHYDVEIAELSVACFQTVAAMKEIFVVPLELPLCAPGFYLAADGFASEFERTREYVLSRQDEFITCAEDEDE